jgi:hypothetical protein
MRQEIHSQIWPDISSTLETVVLYFRLHAQHDSLDTYHERPHSQTLVRICMVGSMVEKKTLRRVLTTYGRFSVCVVVLTDELQGQDELQGRNLRHLLKKHILESSFTSTYLHHGMSHRTKAIEKAMTLPKLFRVRSFLFLMALHHPISLGGQLLFRIFILYIARLY